MNFFKTAAFSPCGKDTFPIHRPADPSAAWYNWKESHSGQFYLLYKAALFVCPEFDTFLMNYTRTVRSYNCKFSGIAGKNRGALRTF